MERQCSHDAETPLLCHNAESELTAFAYMEWTSKLILFKEVKPTIL
jgi:hypothetical protein